MEIRSVEESGRSWAGWEKMIDKSGDCSEEGEILWLERYALICTGGWPVGKQLCRKRQHAKYEPLVDPCFKGNQ